jgi:uncharacterized protein YecE (DUF72 family)
LGKVEDMLYIGTMGWSYGFWKIYPKEMKSTLYLQEYARHFNSVEINNTFYRTPKATIVSDWAKQTPDDFKFTVKFPKSISHSTNLEYDTGKLDVFLKNINKLENKKGPLIIQFPAMFKPDKITHLVDFLDILPSKNLYAVEFRNKDWFTQKTYKLLRDREIAIVQVDHPWLPIINEITSSFVYIRFEGNRKKVNGGKGIQEIDQTEIIKNWAKKIIYYMNQGLQIYGYFSKYFSGYPPLDAINIRKLIDD